MTTYPYGYYGTPQGMGTQLTMAQVQAKTTVAKCNPEFRRRMLAMMEAAAAAGVPLGVGTAWRVQTTNPDGTARPGFALPGNSNHEGFPADGVTGGAVAADMVPTPSFPWMEANCARFGLRTFKNVNNEPWHIQPAEIPANRNQRKEPWVLAKFPLPGDVAAPPPPPTAPKPVPQPEFPLPSYVPTEDEMPLYFKFGGGVYAVKDSGGWRPVDGVELYKLARRSLESVPELTQAELDALKRANPSG